MVWIELIVFLGAIAIGARLGGIGLGFAGGLGVILLAILGVKPGDMPLDVIVIMMAVITAASTMHAAGGMDYLVHLTGKLLRRYPRRISYLAPGVTWLLSCTSGTAMSSFAVLPVIKEVAQENGIRPARPLSLASISSMVAVCASPVSAAVVYFGSLLDETNTGIDYLQILMITMPSTFIAIMVTAFIMLQVDKARGTATLSSMAGWAERKASLDTSSAISPDYAPTKEARRSVLLFGLALIGVVVYSVLVSDVVGLVSEPVMERDQVIVAAMLFVSAAIVVFAKADVEKILHTSTFRSGGSTYICTLGLAWMGNTFISANKDLVLENAGSTLTAHPWLLALILIIACTLLFSQAVTTRALMPLALTLVPASSAVGAFPAVAGMFILPTYATVLGSLGIDDTGSTRVGKFVVNHPFLVPGAINMTILLTISFSLAGILL
ncbi:anaerobic C4-dicarboxylate transporter family protein [Streptomyces sp. NBC_01716]|uniref:anaerobic C4-dicarboxylate transporter family protein n=1 Tax=Streptomyces sp. NBC_01716 TaxID=2975917 RepID=UPI002E327FB2|nr:anaerobic C4-dicarboxylate transporter family protein [Streptomyces sp. NBC_01716]